MNLQSLTILRACLEDAAFSGTDTVPADLRLREAADAFSARAAGDAAAVELAHTAQALFAASEDDRPALLLDALAAANAARCACAQTDVPGTLVPADGRGGYVPVSYSRLRLLTDALSGSGGARFSLLSDAWARFPAWFSDERVRPVLAAALGDPSEEMETLLATILTAQGKSAVPSLKDGFAPDGKREMVRRVYWVARLAGAEENAWLLSILPESRGEVREAVIAALGVSQDNASLLLALYHGEGGKCRDAALRALARMNDEDSRALWIAELERRADCPPCLEGVDAPLAADMAALVLHDAFSEALERERKELALAELLTLAHAVYAAYGKYSEALRQEWLFLAGQMDTLERICADRTVSQWDLNAAEMLEKCLLETVLWNPSEEVRALARELAGVCPAHFLSAAALIDILMRPAEAFDTYRR